MKSINILLCFIASTDKKTTLLGTKKKFSKTLNCNHQKKTDQNYQKTIKYIFTIFKNMKFLEKYYPVLLAFLSFLYSIFLWFSGEQLEGLYVGLWPVTILGFAIAIRQRRNDDLNSKE